MPHTIGAEAVQRLDHGRGPTRIRNGDLCHKCSYDVKVPFSRINACLRQLLRSSDLQRPRLFCSPCF